MALKIVLGVAVVVAIVLLVSFLSTRRGPRLPADLQGALDTAREFYGLPGMAACVVTGEQIEIAASGVREVGNDALVSQADLWHIGSNAKAITATLAGIFVEEGVLKLDDKLSDIFGYPLHADFQHVTLHDLLEHRSGLAAFTAGEEFEPVLNKVSAGTPSEQRAAFAKLLLTQPAAGKHGQFEYSNAGYGIAAAAIELRTGRDWEELLEEKLFGPLGMHVRVGWPASPEDPQQPLGHFDEGKGLQPLPIGDPYELPAALDPAGDLSMPIGDYAKFLQLHLRGMRGLETSGHSGKPILKPETIKLLHTPREGDYSCGWNELRMFDLVESSHDGSAGTFYMTATIDVDSDVAVAVVTNAGNLAAERAVHKVARRLLDAAAQQRAAAQAQ